MHRKHSSSRHHRSGFTLMEVLLVLAILVILGSLVAMQFKGTLEDADTSSAKAQVGLFETPVNLYYFSMKSYPSTLQSLVERPADADALRWKPFMDKAIPKDPWGNDYKIRTPGTHNPSSVDIWSAGRDGVEGTEDDVGNWETGK